MFDKLFKIDQGRTLQHVGGKRALYAFFAKAFLWLAPLFLILGVLAVHQLEVESSGKILAYLAVVFGAGLLLGAHFAMARVYKDFRQSLIRYNSLQKKHRLLNETLEEQKVQNEELHDLEQKNQDIIDSIKDVIFEADEDGKIIFLNKSWQDMTGFEIEQSLGQSLFSVLHRDDQEGVRQEFERLVKGKASHHQSFTQVRKLDGTFGAVEISLSVVAMGQDRSVRIAGTLTDIEERRRAERALGEAEKKYRSIVQNAAGGIYQLTPEGLYLSANPALARILGFEKPEQLLREVKNANESVYADETERFRFIQKLQEQRDTLHHEIQLKRRDGGLIWVSESARAVRDDGGQVLFFEGSVEDITERKEYELTIKEAKMQSDMANRAKSEFLSNMSHELRTPLNSIIGFSEMIKNEVFGPVGEKAYWEYSKDIHESGQQLLRVINEILDISKIEAGERQLNEQKIAVSEVVRDCLGLLEHKIENNDLTTTTFLDGTPDILAEELSVKQILMNLLSNAVKFTPKGGRVTVSGQVDQQGRYHLSVSDTGIGLDDSGIKKALSPFGQVNSELDRSGSGTGLGLTLVDSLIKLHGGEFELFSQKGIGTTATVIFPKERIVQGSSAKAVNDAAQTSTVESDVE